MSARRHRRRNRLLWPAVVVLIWYRDDLGATIRGALSDQARPSAEVAGQLALLAAIALLPLVLIAALLLIALNWLRRMSEDLITRMLAVAVATLIGVRLLAVQPPPSSHVLRPRPVL
jgi:hypothetical protein